MCGREACRRLVCRDCAEGYLKTPQGKEQCFWCRGKNPNLVTDYQAQDNELVHNSKHKEDALQAAASRFMDFYLFEFCFHPLRFDSTESSDALEPALLRDLIRLLVDSDTVRLPEGDDPDRYFINVVPSDAARVALLRSLLALKDPTSKEIVESELYRTLKEDASNLMLDTPLCVTYSRVQQGFMEAKCKTISDAIKACECELDLSHFGAFSSQVHKFPVHCVLQTVALTRRAVCIFADGLLRHQKLHESEAHLRPSEQKEDDTSKASMTERARLERKTLSSQLLLLRDALEPVFSHKCPAHRSVRFFLLKKLERQRGASFVRLALSQTEMLKGSTWLSEWLSSGEVGLLRFMGESKLPTHNPFVSLPMFTNVHQAVSSALVQGGSCDLLEKLVSSLKTPVEKARLKGALVAALFHEVYILAVLDEVPSSFQKQASILRAWVLSSPSLKSCTEKEMNLFLFFCQFNDAGGIAATQLLHLSPSSSPDQISIVRIMVHAVAACISESASSSHGNLLSWFFTATFTPEALKDTFWPAMPEDVQAMAIRVLGGRWYRCPNGHSYYVVRFF